MAKEDIILTFDQKQIIDKQWDKIRFPDLVKLVFKNNDLDGRSLQGKAVRQYLGEERSVISAGYQPKEQIELTEEQKEYIRNNVKSGESATSMARTLFNNNKLTTLGLEARAILSYINDLPEEISGKSHSDEIGEEYYPPNTVKQVISKVNEYCQKNFVYEDLNSQQKKKFENLLSLFKSLRFLHMMSSYSSKTSRKIFEGEFTKAVFEEPDLNYNDLNLYINLISNYIQEIQVRKHLNMLNERYEAVIGDPDGKIATAMADMISARTKELNDCDTRQQKLIKDLSGSRAEKNKNKTASTLSIAGLLEWWSEESTRRKGIELAEMKKREVIDEVDRLTNMDEIKATIVGLNISELVNG